MKALLVLMALALLASAAAGGSAEVAMPPKEAEMALVLGKAEIV